MRGGDAGPVRRASPFSAASPAFGQWSAVMGADPATASEPVWSALRVEMLRLHHAMGLSAALSAQLIGDVSRNAVISKRRRLGLVGANPLQAALRAIRGAVRPAACTSSKTRPSGLADAIGRLELRCEPLPFMDWPPPAGAQPKSLAQRDPGECAWPLGPGESPGDYRTLFCCAPVDRGRVYCTEHRRRAFIVRELSECSPTERCAHAPRPIGKAR
jgi:hypothetical protein